MDTTILKSVEHFYLQTEQRNRLQTLHLFEMFSAKALEKAYGITSSLQAKVVM